MPSDEWWDEMRDELWKLNAKGSEILLELSQLNETARAAVTTRRQEGETLMAMVQVLLLGLILWRVW